MNINIHFLLITTNTLDSIVRCIDERNRVFYVPWLFHHVNAALVNVWGIKLALSHYTTTKLIKVEI